MQDENTPNTVPEPPVNVPVQTDQPAPVNPSPQPVQATAAEASNEPAPEQKPPKKESSVASFIVTLIVAFVLVQLINVFFFQSYKVYGSSMYSTLHDGDRLIISKVGRTEAKIRGKNFQPKRGQVIVFIDPQNPDLQLIKRVIGLPGERVTVHDGKLTVYNKQNPNGFNPDDAPYGKNLPASSGDNDVTVPANHLFVSGDNREGSNSLDSRNELGTVPEKNIVGTLKVRIFPFNTTKFF